MRIRSILAAAVLAVAVVPAPAHAAGPGMLAFVRNGNIWLKPGAGTPWQVTTTGTAAWPKLSPDGLDIAYADHGDIYTAFIGAGPGTVVPQRLTHDGQAGGPDYSPDGSYLAYRTGDVHSAMLVLLRLGSSESAVVSHPTEGFDPLRTANTVAWSPDGQSIAFPGGDCWGVFDDCLTVLDLLSNHERTVAAWGGGGEELSGFATTPSWSADSRKLFWTQQEDTPQLSQPGPVRAIGWKVGATRTYQVGADGDGTPVHLGHGAFLVSATHDGKEWIARIKPGGAREWLVEGGQPDWRD